MIIHFIKLLQEACHIRSRWEYPVKELVHQFRSLRPVPIYYHFLSGPFIHPASECAEAPQGSTSTHTSACRMASKSDLNPASASGCSSASRYSSVSIFSQFPLICDQRKSVFLSGFLKSYTSCPRSLKKPRSVAGIRCSSCLPHILSPLSLSFPI